eukprot:symbB.v1.2.035527.t1/scaffold4806.1/size34549/1
MGRQAANGCEAWDPASRTRHNLWRLFVGKVLNATVFIALNVVLDCLNCVS